MLRICAFSLLLLGVASEQVTPVQKVIQMLNGMVAKGKNDKEQESTQFAAYKQFCDDTATKTKRSIAQAEETMEMLSADIQKYTTDAETLAADIAELDKELSIIDGDMKAASAVRQQEHSDFQTKQRDYQESVQSVETAEDVVKAEAHDIALTQLVQNPKLDEKSRKAIAAFLAQPTDDDDENLAFGTPEAHTFESSSSGILDLFKKMAGKFDDQIAVIQKQEMKDKHNFQMLMSDLTNQKNTALGSRQEKSEAKAKNLEAAAEAKSSLADTTATRDSDAHYLADLDATCTQKANDFSNRQTLRAEEIAALEQATEVLAGGAVSGSADKHLPALAQIHSASFAQLRAMATNPNQVRVAAFLRDASTRFNSKVLEAISVRVAYDPFKSVKKMLKEMVVKLMEEANEEAEHKGWCDTELATNEQTRSEKTEAVEMLHAEIDELQATIAKLSEEISDLSAAIAASDTAVKEATEMREAEKAKNTATIKDAVDAQEAVANALNVLREFYDKAATATSLAQTGKKNAKAPEIFDESYRGMGAESGGVMGMIEVIQSDFARLESETSTAEASAQKEYDGFISDSAADKAAKSTDVEHKQAKKQNSEQALTEGKDDLAGTQEELSAAMEYYDKLKPSCVNEGVNYEDRVSMRKAEIESLQEALKILNGEDIA